MVTQSESSTETEHTLSSAALYQFQQRVDALLRVHVNISSCPLLEDATVRLLHVSVAKDPCRVHVAGNWCARPRTDGFEDLYVADPVARVASHCKG